MGTNPHWHGNKDTHGTSLDTNWFCIQVHLGQKRNKAFVCNAFCNKYSGCRNVISFVCTLSLFLDQCSLPVLDTSRP